MKSILLQSKLFFFIIVFSLFSAGYDVDDDDYERNSSSWKNKNKILDTKNFIVFGVMTNFENEWIECRKAELQI